MKLFTLQIATPDGMKYDGKARQLSVRGVEGELSVLCGHIPFVTALSEGECRVYTEKEGEILRAHVLGGMLLVSNDMVRVLSYDFRWLSD